MPFIGIIAVLAVVGLGYYLATSGGLSSSDSSGGQSIQSYAANAGFSGDDLTTAVAIAYAESSGDPNALGDPNLGVSVGLWQINLKAHPEYTEDELYDPQTNANAAFAVYQAAGSKFTPWTTYKTGAYQKYLGDANG